ncbi:hypothetical protein SNEBB_010788 [Seison nebaliae]|nr:hypothetical protein SNEBB_010788 [Seison nebaliae]
MDKLEIGLLLGSRLPMWLGYEANPQRRECNINNCSNQYRNSIQNYVSHNYEETGYVNGMRLSNEVKYCPLPKIEDAIKKKKTDIEYFYAACHCNRCKQSTPIKRTNNNYLKTIEQLSNDFHKNLTFKIGQIDNDTCNILKSPPCAYIPRWSNGQIWYLERKFFQYRQNPNQEQMKEMADHIGALYFDVYRWIKERKKIYFSGRQLRCTECDDSDKKGFRYFNAWE